MAASSWPTVRRAFPRFHAQKARPYDPGYREAIS